MGVAITLAAHGGALELVSDAKGRCRLWLATGRKRRNLGADHPTRVVDRLLQPLQGRPDVSGQGGDLTWVLSLSDPHSAFYHRLAADTHHLIIQNEHAEVVGELAIGPDQVERWRQALESFRNRD